jgi:hypothetical protein
MSVNDSEPRKLSFPLNRSVSPIVSGGDFTSPASTTPEWQTLDNDEIVTITLTVSLNEFVALASAIDAGRDLAYSEKSIELWQIWVKAVNTLSLCQQIADCINDPLSPARIALIEAVGTSGGGYPVGDEVGSGANVPVSGSVNDANIMGTSVYCNEDNMYAVTTALADIAMDAVNQLYQALNLVSAPIELASELSDNAPAVASAAPATAMDWALWVKDTAYDAFLVFDTGQERIDIACALLCIAQENGCSLSFDDIANYFYGRSPVGVVGKTLEELLVFAIDFTVPEAVGTMSLALFFSLLSLGSKIGGVKNVGGLMMRLYAFIDETNNNWTVDCDPCGITTINRLNGNGNGGMYGTIWGVQAPYTNLIGIYTPDKYIAEVASDKLYSYCGATYEFGQPTTITSVYFRINVKVNRGAVDSSALVYYDGILVSTTPLPNNGAWTEYEINTGSDASVQTILIKIIVAQLSSDDVQAEYLELTITL